MQSRLHQTHNTPHAVLHQQVRFAPVIHLESGDAVAALVETRSEYADRAAFGPAAVLNSEQANPAKWLASQIEDIAAAADLLEVRERPLLVRAPIAAFAHSGTAEACEAAVIRSKLCPQEICLEFSDAALASSPQDTANRVRNLRRRGFRVSIDARKAWNAKLSSALRITIDTYRINAECLESNSDLQEKCEIAAASGITVIAERARWRDADWLVDFGVEHAIRPKADA